MTRLSRVMEAVDQLHSDELFDVDVVDVTTDSREVRPGWIFVAVRGTSFDGHTAITNAIAAGAVAIVAEIAPNGPCGVPVVTVKDSRLAFAQIVRVVTNGRQPDFISTVLPERMGRPPAPQFLSRCSR
ncbi:MAG: hypothetical protein IPM83_06165 [Ignavibacteria bacterium]|nr:hypothetical protein [Ignavibacteria bacterium]